MGLTLLASCKEKVAKFVIDSSKLTDLTRYSYEYRSGKLTSSIDTTYVIMFGQAVDTMVTLVNYEYNNKGLLKREISKTAFDDIPTIQLYDYNSNDSIIREMTISPENDTTYWTEYNYFPDGKKMVYRRTLFLHDDPTQDLSKLLENKQFDTAYCRMKYEYENNLCKSSKEYDQKNNLIRTIEYYYENGRPHKAITIIQKHGIEVTEKTQYFDYSKSDIHPDYYSIDLNKDTVEYCKNEFIKHSISTTTDVFNHGKLVVRTFYENGKKIGSVGIDKITNTKFVESCSYDENGDLKEIKSYHEEM